MRIPALLFMFACSVPAVMRAQACPPAPTPSGGSAAWFEFQVDTAARFHAKGAVLPYPDASLNQAKPFPSDFALVQFVVDTSGVPVVTSLKFLNQPAGLVADSVTAAVQRWRFTPANASGCKVAQLVQTALRWK